MKCNSCGKDYTETTSIRPRNLCIDCYNTPIIMNRVIVEKTYSQSEVDELLGRINVLESVNQGLKTTIRLYKAEMSLIKDKVDKLYESAQSKEK
jgi:hypothetical protein